MSYEPIKVLLIEDNPGDARLIKETLIEASDDTFDLEWVDSLSKGISRLHSGGVDLVLLDLGLPDSQGIDTFARLHARVPQVPVVLLTGHDDETLAVEIVKEGAQEYLVKGQADGATLVRCLRHALERHRLIMEAQAMSLVDELTGLHNRRGFLTLAQKQLEIADRNKDKVFLIYADLDNMKWINDALGHLEGDRALKNVAAVLKVTFRKSDIVARIGGDEFVIFAVGLAGSGVAPLCNRLLERLRRHNAEDSLPYTLSLSIGVTRYDPECPCSLEELIRRADESMYEEKKAKKAS